MNRRSFITKALTGLVAVPVLGKLAQASESRPDIYGGPCPVAYGGYVVTRDPVDLESVHIDGRKVFDRECNERRRAIINTVDFYGVMFLSPANMAETFADFDHQAIEWWAEEHGLVIQARPNGLIRVARA